MSWLTLFWHKYVGVKEPWAVEVKDSHGQLSIKDCNAAYVRDLRARLPEELTSAATNDEVIKLWTDRYNHEKIEPKLEVVHSGILPDGRIKMQLEWNDAFIRQLQERGIQGETEEKMVENYLAAMTRKVDADMYDDEEGADRPAAPMLPDEHDIERELQNMDPEVVRRLERTIRRRSQLKSPRKRSFG